MNQLERARKAPRKAAKTGRPLHTIRTKDGGKKTFRYAKTQAIRLMCMQCLGWEDSPRDCTATLCPLYPFRGSTMASQKGDKE